MHISFQLNGERVDLGPEVSATTTLLDWLRETRGLTGTKEGCNEGDCGACTVMVRDLDGARALNACILFLPQLHGKSVTTVEGLAGKDGSLHPVQQAMVDHHGSQCGFCTPGFVMSMATARINGDTNDNDVLAGNLCRCTGYAPIVRAAEAARAMAPDPTPARFEWPEDLIVSGTPFIPMHSDQLAEWYLDHPDATLVGGATDLGLQVTKQLKDLGDVAFLNQCYDLRQMMVTDSEIRVGAAVTVTEFMYGIEPFFAGLARMLSRYGSTQVRNAATVGGNIANGSPIGDSPPALIALGATLHLRKGAERRSMPLEDFFLDYGKQDRAPGEFVEAVTIPRQPDRLACYKLSKRFDQDISAVLGCFNITVEDGTVTAARIAFGGMAGVPKRAEHVESTLIGLAWNEDAVDATKADWPVDFQPMSDMRASADYRLKAAWNMLRRYWAEDAGIATDVRKVRA
ncbi:xanthine dehydrogenase small subunit [Pseudooceanicola atlanticus]|uniref:FAD-binding molybdopterin dehydrogenase n=1 Tax=Pseudooceanicola atlanticus TaxID=1461694 RepID=A0A0A0EBV8_9RHOB|nr:xanthine dehydrogenase small subunit [Pseudooceanicola atlanticus]KGM47618.1 FAD-binding molybdopterin dehydrogenase [Pseudooceanicola atlanticus]